MIKTTTTKRFSGAGGAHIGFRMFGARGPLLGEADGTGSGAGSEEGATGAGAAGAGDPPADDKGGGGNAGAKTFTQGQVDAIVKDRVAQAKRSVQKQTPAAEKPPEEAGEKLTMKALSDRLDEEMARRTFDRKANKLGLSDEASDDLFTLYQAQKPANTDEWFESKSKLFGASTNNQTANPNAASEQQQQAKPKASAAPNAPAKVNELVSANGAVDIYMMSPEQFAATTPEKIKEHHERNLTLAIGRSGAPPVPRISLQKK